MRLYDPMGQITIKKHSKSSKRLLIAKRKTNIEKQEKQVQVSKPKITRREFLRNIFFTVIGFTVLEKTVNEIQKKPEPIVLEKTRNVPTSFNGEKGAGRPELQNALEQYIENTYSSGKIENDERTAWLAYDLIRKETLVSINADVSMQCASMVKPFVALAFFHKVNKGELVCTEKDKRFLRLMIQHSWNTATNWFMKQVGGPDKVNELLHDNYPEIFQHTEIVEYIPPGGTTYKNMSSASDYNRFLRSMWNKTIPHADDIKELMGLPNRDRSGDLLSETQIYHKSGSTARMCGDIAILETACQEGVCAYTFIGIIDRYDSVPDYMRWKRIRVGIIREASTLVYDAIKKDYRFG
jgi:beta-lactamase class A